MEMPSSPVSVQSPRVQATELEYHLLLAKNLGLIQPRDHEELAQRTIKLNACSRAGPKAEC